MFFVFHVSVSELKTFILKTIPANYITDYEECGYDTGTIEGLIDVWYECVANRRRFTKGIFIDRLWATGRCYLGIEFKAGRSLRTVKNKSQSLARSLHKSLDMGLIIESVEDLA